MEEKKKREQMQLAIKEFEKNEQEKEAKEHEIKSKVSAWIAENPEAFQKIIENEKMNAGERVISENQAKIAARLSVKILLGLS